MSPANLTYAWEWSGDNAFDEASGPHPLFPAASYAVGTIVNIALRVTDSASHSTISTTSVQIIPAALHVDASATGAADGSSWTNAFPRLESALALALPGQAIKVAGGTYLPTTTTDRSAAFRLPSGVQVLGGFAGGQFANPNDRDSAIYPTILSAISVRWVRKQTTQPM